LDKSLDEYKEIIRSIICLSNRTSSVCNSSCNYFKIYNECIFSNKISFNEVLIDQYNDKI
jgi:hypothetical protein